MRILVINLMRATERRQKMERQAADLGMHFDFLEAVDGKIISDAERALVDHTKRKSITPYPLSDNEIACWLSHKKAMQELVQSKESMLAITEDDAQLTADFPRILAAIEKQAGSFDLIDLHRNFKRGEIFVPCRDLVPGFALGRVGYTHMKATAYVISRAGAEKFLNYAKNFAHAVDKEMHRYWANGLDIYGLENPVAKEMDEGHSYIDETRGQNRPQERLRYPDADQLQWRARRFLTKFSDSVSKRLFFPFYAEKGKRAV